MSKHVFTLPDLGEGLTEAEIVRWLVGDGDVIEIDQPVVEVETAKAVVEVPSPRAGRVAVRHAPEGTTLEVGAPLLTVAAVTEADTYREEERAGSGNVLVGYGTKDSSTSARRRRPRAASPSVPASDRAPQMISPPAPASDRAPQVISPPAPASDRAPQVISPIVRRLAREAGVDLSRVAGTGPGGVITRRDLPAATVVPGTGGPAATVVPGTGGPTVAPAPGERRVPLSGFRKAVSAVLSRSRAEIPEATVWVDVDATALWDLRERTRGQAGSPGLLAYIARFVTAGLRQYPVLNARLDTERQEIVQLDTINLGIAVQTDRGLVVPAVMNAQSMTATDLDTAIRDVTARARHNQSTPAELTAGTFTLNNYGAFRVDGSAAIINHPQVAMLGLGRIIDRPWVVDGTLTIRKITQLSFVFDHRVCDGGTAAGFIRAVADAMEDPSSALARL